MTKETGGQRAKRINTAREDALREMLHTHPNLEIDRSEFGAYAINYTPLYSDAIHVLRNTRVILSKPLSMEGKFLTKRAAVDAITPVVDNAKQKFAEIYNAFKELQSEFNCSIDSFCPEYDWVGCCLQVSFKMDGFDFYFTLTD